jgi:hypothetical protein
MPIEQETAVFHGRLKKFLLRFETTLRLSNVFSLALLGIEDEARREWVFRSRQFIHGQPTIHPTQSGCRHAVITPAAAARSRAKARVIWSDREQHLQPR